MGCSPIPRTLGLSTGVWNIFDSARWAMIVVFLNRTLARDAGAIGVIFSAGSVGFLLGSFVPATIARKLGLGPAIMPGAAVLPRDLLIALAGRRR